MNQKIPLLLILTFVLAGCTTTPQTTQTQNSTSNKNAAPVVAENSQNNSNNQEVDQKDYDIQKVTRVIDGDTIELENGDTVRYIGIDTPETVHPSKPVQCFGKEASAKNSQLVLNKEVRLEKDVSDTDRYGRLLRYVYVGDTLINLELVKQGYAYSSSYPPDVKHQDQFRNAQSEAENNKRGLWSSCVTEEVNTPKPEPEPQPIVTPEPEPIVVPQPTTCDIKGNISSSGEKIYHYPGCASYSRTKIDESKGERWFCTNAEAEAAGWRVAGNC